MSELSSCFVEPVRSISWHYNNTAEIKLDFSRGYVAFYKKSKSLNIICTFKLAYLFSLLYSFHSSFFSFLTLSSYISKIFIGFFWSFSCFIQKIKKHSRPSKSSNSNLRHLELIISTLKGINPT